MLCRPMQRKPIQPVFATVPESQLNFGSNASIPDYQWGEIITDHPLIFWPPDKPLSESPGPVVDGIPIGILPVENFAQLDKWQQAWQVKRPPASFMATLAMGASPFLEKIEEIRGALETAFPRQVVHNWQAV